MERKPLININEMYCENGEGINPAYNMLLSGNMIPVKERVINTVLQKNNLPIVIINLDNNVLNKFAGLAIISKFIHIDNLPFF